jgi:hypothetical protein
MDSHDWLYTTNTVIINLWNLLYRDLDGNIDVSWHDRGGEP